jgi:hypothetical protein
VSFVPHNRPASTPQKLGRMLVFLEPDVCLFCLGRYTFETPPSAITREGFFKPPPPTEARTGGGHCVGVVAFLRVPILESTEGKKGDSWNCKFQIRPWELTSMVSSPISSRSWFASAAVNLIFAWCHQHSDLRTSKHAYQSKPRPRVRVPSLASFLLISLHAPHGLSSSPPAERTFHVISQPDISCATDTVRDGSLTKGSPGASILALALARLCMCWGRLR